ncbi:hypothetical protein EV356DRAFT_496525 [Viridothelium virens]|uniref:Uncharacterized protein n=1 Tax=Viridothelium virens TaxID=1048519 RepID=A0A6A6GU36_VIRVR|nr:hypothetical protein EV356DRAFT_496525 [Viridothelium virens]
MTDKGITALVHERETYRHLDLSAVHGFVDNANDPIPPARPGRDRALTAFAQLGLLRLGAHRAFVSLFDRRYQYVIAETTASSTLRSSPDKPTDENLLLCGLAFPHSQGVSSHALEVTSDSLAACSTGGGNKDDAAWTMPVIVVPDVQVDSRFASSRFLNAHEDIRFYASVPIRSPAGSLIGVFSVTDSKPREALGNTEADFLRDMSSTIMDHLVLVRYRQDEARGKRMMRGLGSFVEGMTTITGLSSDQWSTRPGGDAGQEGMLNVAQQARMHEETGLTNGEDNATLQDVHGTQSCFAPESSSSPPASPTSNSAERRASGETDVPHRFFKSVSESPSLAGSVKSGGKSTSLTGTPSPAPSAHDIRSLFSRAANTIRESIEVEGVLFFDASVTTYGGMIESEQHDSCDTGNSHNSQSSSSGEESVRSVRSGSNRRLRDDKTCEIFGFSTTGIASIDGDKPNAEHLAVPERFLHLLLRRYPEGKIFNFDEEGVPLSDTESDSDHQDSASSATAAITDGSSRGRRQRQQSFARSKEPSFIIKVFPNARSVLAFPLWDSHRSRWYAGGVAWTRTPTRVFSVKSELSYLRAFGATIMAEVAKIDAQQANRVKTDVLGSISHELRSPLHGILGGVELLQETSIDVFQDSTVHTIERCSMTLLDTINHLLDYAKVNNIMRASKTRRQTPRRDGDSQASNMMDRNSTAVAWDVDIGSIIEEVVESVFAGHEFEASSNSLDTQADLMSPDPTVRDLDTEVLSKQIEPTSRGTSHDQVKIILDISPAASWRFSTQPGAVRRIVMNIFGNALKYTVGGHIKVTVDQKELPGKGAPISEVKIIVEDTGKGISKEYLAHHLYTPFSQENSLSPGTGLGLSITHKIVTSLGGTIDAQSETGRGSTMSISLPLPHSTSAETSHENSTFAVLISRTKGLRVSLSGFNDTVALTAQGIPNKSKDWQLPRTAIARQCQAWLYMDVLPSTETAIKPDIYLATLAGAEALADMNKAGVVIQPVVVICPSAAVARHLSTTSRTIERNGVFEYIAQPCGPRKLAKTFTLALDRWADIQLEQASQMLGRLPGAFSSSSVHTQEQPDEDSSSIAQRNVTTSASTSPSITPSKATSSPTNSTEHQPHPPQPISSRDPDLSPKSTPDVLPPPSAPSAASPPTPDSDIAPYLIVDDNAINLKLLSTYLRRQNLPVATATNGALAVAAYQAARGAFSCIFMDIQMPQLDGVAASRAIREYEMRERLDPVCIVVLTGLATKENIQEAKASGANEFFPKPVRLKLLDPVLGRARRKLAGKSG